MGKHIINGCIQLSDADMYYAAFGTGPRTLIVLPGLSDGLATVKGKARLLSLPYRKHLDEFTVYMFSRKNTMPAEYSIRDMAADQVLAMQKLGFEKACILGVSQGGMIAQYMAIDHPEIVDKLILAVTAPSANETVKNVISAWIEMAERRDHTALMVDTAKRVYSETYLRKSARYFPLIARLTKPASYDRFMSNARAILAFDARDELHKIKAPTLIISGGKDKTVGTAAAVEMHDGIAGSELFVYDDLGHGAYEEAGDFYDRVFTFCRVPLPG